MISVFTEARDDARRSGRCMACDGRTRQFTHGGYAALCGHPDCERYYQALFQASRRVERAAAERARYRRNLTKVNGSPETRR